MKRASILAVLLAAGCAGMQVTYHRVQLGTPERNLYVLISEDEDMEENPVALLERLERRHDEKLHVVVGQIAERSFAAIDSGCGATIVTKGGRGSPDVASLLREVEQRLAVAADIDARQDLVFAKKILEGLPKGRDTGVTR
jgi:hypothetical protein